MSMTTTVILNVALDLAVLSAILGLAAWAIRTGQHDIQRARARRAHARRLHAAPSRAATAEQT